MSIDEFYHDARTRIAALVADLSPQERAAPVPACPGWQVRDVVAHLAAAAEDAAAGRLRSLTPEHSPGVVWSQRSARARPTAGGGGM